MAAYPGTFDPLTVAHLAVAEAVHRQLAVERVDLVVSRRPLGKEIAGRPRLEDRVEVLGRACGVRPWLGVAVTDARLLVDVAAGYDLLVVGADKWAQLVDVSWYGTEEQRDAALRRLPRVAVAPRPPHRMPDGVTILDVSPAIAAVSSTGARAGEWTSMAPEAAEFDRETGAWSDPERYKAWLVRTGA